MGLKEMFDVKTIKPFKLSAYPHFYTEETLPREHSLWKTQMCACTCGEEATLKAQLPTSKLQYT